MNHLNTIKKCIYSHCNRIALLLLFSGLIGLSACNDSTQALEELNRDQQETAQQKKSQKNTYNEDGQPLTDAATQFTDASKVTLKGQQKNQVANHLQHLVGRYQTEIECSDLMVNCKTGVAEFVLNLLSDGTAHRTIIYLGKIKAGDTNEYYDDHWSYDAEYNQILVQRSNGVIFFYDIDENQNLSFSIKRTSNYNDRNRTYFKQGNFLPQKAYILIKVD